MTAKSAQQATPDIPESACHFTDLCLPEKVQRALDDCGYATPTPIQSAVIPHMLAGRDVIGQAQTGTGKTAAFALPVLARLDPTAQSPQVLVLAPTRELANQVAEACMNYGRHLPGLRIAAVYGGAGYHDQLRDLRRGAQIVVGTPGRVMDHMQRGSLDLSDLRCLVLDEADEMLQMGFIDDVEWIISQAPAQRQVALFSATMPAAIRRIAQRYLSDPKEIAIRAATATADTVRQRYWFVRGLPKYEAVARMIEGEPTEGVLVFTRTKAATTELADGLVARGLAAAALNGDMVQAQRERVVDQLKRGDLDVLVATDVAARGLDVQRISHVINYDMPSDAETYVHRIGRTGRAGRSGEAIVCVHPREKGMLRSLERRTRQSIAEMQLPDVKDINRLRAERFALTVHEVSQGDLTDFEALVQTVVEKHGLDPLRAAAALARMAHGDQPLFLQPEQPHQYAAATQRGPRSGRDRRGPFDDGPPRGRKIDRRDAGQQQYRIDVGHVHGTRPGMIVGAIANELGLPGEAIGAIRIHDNYSMVSLPGDMPAKTVAALSRIRVAGRALAAKRFEAGHPRR